MQSLVFAKAKQLIPTLTGVQLKFRSQDVSRGEPVAITNQFGDESWCELRMHGGTLPSWWCGVRNHVFDRETLEKHWEVRDWIMKGNAVKSAL